MTADDVMKILKGTKSSVKLVVARMVSGEQSQEVLMANEVYCSICLYVCAYSVVYYCLSGFSVFVFYILHIVFVCV